MTYILTYGTLKRHHGNHGVLGDALYIDDAITHSGEFTMFDGGFPFVCDRIDDPDNMGRVVGELYETFDQQTLDRLDRLEGVPTLYVKREVDVTTMAGITYRALIYVASEGSTNRLNGRIPMKPEGRSRLLEWSNIGKKRK